jgi:hypothetical protein
VEEDKCNLHCVLRVDCLWHAFPKLFFYQNIAYFQLKVHSNFNFVWADFIASSVTDELDCAALSDSWCVRRIFLSVTISRLFQNLVECGHFVKVNHSPLGCAKGNNALSSATFPFFMVQQRSKQQLYLSIMFHNSCIFSVARGRIHSGVLTGIWVPASFAGDSSET